jgi:cellulose synthase/poly-beta-1,6-N-acetylglucosamine synthase-like glycosyltransferase
VIIQKRSDGHPEPVVQKPFREHRHAPARAHRQARTRPWSAATSRLTVTVLISADNEEHALGPILDSLTEQTQTPDRVVVVADNCTGRIQDIARDHGVEVYQTRQNSDGKAGALNQALGTVTTDIVMVLGAEARIAPTFLQEGLCLLEADRHLGAVGANGSLNIQPFCFFRSLPAG